jgi:hypothetical protein
VRALVSLMNGLLLAGIGAMVMEMPSPQCVGQEFVRQYYTLLHEAPNFMHR